MELSPIAEELDELENRIDRLRALYEQYFMGIERLEPWIPRKDVERRIHALRKAKIRNTGERFKFQMLAQRYNTLQQHWGRITREIERGTYKRAVRRGTAPAQPALTIAARRRRAHLVAAEPEDAIEELDLEPDELVDEHPVAPPAPTPPAPPSQPTRAPLGLTFGRGAPRPPPPSGPSAPSQPRPPAEPPPARSGSPGAAPVSSSALHELRKAAVQAKSSSLGREGGLSIDLDLAAPFASDAPQKPASPPPRPAAPPARPAPRAATPPPRSPLRSQPIAPPAPPPKPPARSAPPAPAVAARAPALAPAPAAPRPPAPAPRAETHELSEPRLRQIYDHYIERRRELKEPTAGITYDKLAASLRAQATKLRSAHAAKNVDYEVTTQNGRTVLKPILR